MSVGFAENVFKVRGQGHDWVIFDNFWQLKITCLSFITFVTYITFYCRVVASCELLSTFQVSAYSIVSSYLVVLAILVFPLSTILVVFIVMHCWTFSVSETLSNFNCMYVCMYVI